MAKLYTKKGDKGLTSLSSQRNIPKSDSIFYLLGDLDELSAHIGLLISMENREENLYLRKIQNTLLDIGSWVSGANIIPLTEEDIKEIEKNIDINTAKTPPLTEFILQGCTPLDAQAHICRVIARRVERNFWSVYTTENVPGNKKKIGIFLNRLSDYFFSLARVYSNNKEYTRKEFREKNEINLPK